VTNADTVNSKYTEKSSAGSFAISGIKKTDGGQDSTINIRPGLPVSVTAYYNNGAGWSNFPATINASLLSSTVGLRINLKDKCGNAVDTAAIGAFATGASQSAWDTTIQKGAYVWGPEPNIKDRNPYYPLTDTMFVFARMADNGEINIRWKPENCIKGKVTFRFFSYADSVASTLLLAPTFTTNDANYYLNITPNNAPAQVRLVSTSVPTRTYYPVGDTTKAQTLLANGSRGIVTLRAYLLNSCGETILDAVDTSAVTFDPAKITAIGAAYNSSATDLVGSFVQHAGTSNFR